MVATAAASSTDRITGTIGHCRGPLLSATSRSRSRPLAGRTLTGPAARWWNETTYVPFGISTTRLSSSAFGAVVLRQFEAKPAGLYPDGGIMLRIEVVRAPKNLGRDLVFLQR